MMFLFLLELKGILIFAVKDTLYYLDPVQITLIYIKISNMTNFCQHLTDKKYNIRLCQNYTKVAGGDAVDAVDAVK